MDVRRLTTEPFRKTYKPTIHYGSSRVVEDPLADERSIEAAAEEHSLNATAYYDAATEYRGYEALVTRTVDVFGDELTASRWLSMPTPDLDGATPIEIAEGLHYDPADVRKIFEPIFIRIEHGIDV